MKTQISEREIRKRRPTNLYAFGYCEIDELLRYEEPLYYTAGIYGRKADFYKIEDPDTLDRVWISTGYGPIGERVDYEKTRQAEQEARKYSYSGVDYKLRKIRNRKKLYRLCKG